MNPARLLDCFELPDGIVCAVGAGGKKTVLYQLLQAWPGRAAFSTSVFTHPFPDDFPFPIVEAPRDRIEAAVLAAAAQHDKLAYVCPSDKPDRHAGLAVEQILCCHEQGRFGLTVVKADGARMRLLKAPGEREPNLVPGASAVIGVVSARVVGKALSSQYVHRPAQLAAVTGAREGDAITAADVARLVTGGQGLFKGVGQTRRLPVINMADRPEHLEVARAIAREVLVLDPGLERVLVTSLQAPGFVREIWTPAGRRSPP